MKNIFSNTGYGHEFVSNLMLPGINAFLKLSF